MNYLNLLFVSIVFLACDGNTIVLNQSPDHAKQYEPIKKTDTLHWLGGPWLGQAAREQLLFETKRVYEFENQEVFIDLEFKIKKIKKNTFGTVENPEEKILDGIRNKNYPWDVFWYDKNVDHKYAKQLNNKSWGAEHLVDFSEFDFFKEYHKDFIYENDQYRNQTGGILTGPYIEGYSYILWYNSVLANEMNLDIKQFDMNIDDFIGYLKKVKSYNEQYNTNYAAIYAADSLEFTSYLFENLMISLYGTFDYEKISAEEKVAALQEVFKKYEEMGRYDPLTNNQYENNWYETRHYPLENKCVFFINGSWMYNMWEGIDAEKTEKMIPAQLPHMKNSNTYVGGYIPSFAVFKNSPAKKAGIELLKYFCLPETAEKWVNYTKSPTGLKENLTESNFDLDPLDIFRKTITKKYGTNMHYYNSYEYLSDENVYINSDLINNLLSELLKGKITAEKAIELTVEYNI